MYVRTDGRGKVIKVVNSRTCWIPMLAMPCYCPIAIYRCTQQASCLEFQKKLPQLLPPGLLHLHLPHASSTTYCPVKSGILPHAREPRVQSAFTVSLFHGFTLSLQSLPSLSLSTRSIVTSSQSRAAARVPSFPMACPRPLLRSSP